MVPAGTYTLTLAGIDQAAAVGDLDLTGFVDIVGADAPRTVVDGGGALLNDHVFEVLPGTVVSLTGLTIRNGGSSTVAAGGGIYVAGLLTLRDSIIAGCTAVDGGAIAVAGTTNGVTIDKATLRYNRASGNGGAIGRPVLHVRRVAGQCDAERQPRRRRWRRDLPGWRRHAFAEQRHDHRQPGR